MPEFGSPFSGLARDRYHADVQPIRMIEKTIVFLTKVKCEMIAQDIDHRLGSNVIKITHSGSAREHRKDGGAFAVGIHK